MVFIKDKNKYLNKAFKKCLNQRSKKNYLNKGPKKCLNQVPKKVP